MARTCLVAVEGFAETTDKVAFGWPSYPLDNCIMLVFLTGSSSTVFRRTVTGEVCEGAGCRQQIAR